MSPVSENELTELLRLSQLLAERSKALQEHATALTERLEEMLKRHVDKLTEQTPKP